MSAINGDKSRYHRQRKQKLALRARNQERMQAMSLTVKPAAKAAVSKPEAVSA
jgi:hypothetical protein